MPKHLSLAQTQAKLAAFKTQVQALRLLPATFSSLALATSASVHSHMGDACGTMGALEVHSKLIEMTGMPQLFGESRQPPLMLRASCKTLAKCVQLPLMLPPSCLWRETV